MVLLRTKINNIEGLGKNDFIRYNGKDAFNEKIIELMRSQKLFSFVKNYCI
jgi:hypothetical protein